MTKLGEIFEKKTVLVTGHTGFKGSWLSMWLNELGARVIGVSVDLPTVPCHFEAISLKNDIQEFRIDLRDSKELEAVMMYEKPDFVFHLAAQPLVRRSYDDPINTYRTNVLGTAHVLEAIRQLEKKCVAIMITSDKSYKNVEAIWGYRENDELGGPDPYSASKGAAEFVIQSYVRSFFQHKMSSIRLGIGRAGNVIGGGDWADDRIVPDCVRAWSQGRAVELRSGESTRPWQHVLEPLSGYLTLAMALHEDGKYHGDAFNFGPPPEQNHTVAELVRHMETRWGGVRWTIVPNDSAQKEESKLLKLNCDKALHYLKWNTVLNFEETVAMTAEWYKDYYFSEESAACSTQRQIRYYVKLARERQLSWAI